ncbi:hypothetical protein MO973_22145 [Paenibacillus sp. TRM 82003]|nr:hypothetical protein [Paenibacillus sp. TRM 82003]
MRDVYGKLVEINDRQTDRLLTLQITSPGGRNDGGILQPDIGVPTASHGGTAGAMACMAAALLSPESKHYRSEAALSALDRAASFMLRRQHEDGTISLGGTNFNSPPDTGFVVAGLCQLYGLLSSCGWAPMEGTAAKVRLFLERAIPALTTGGVHTPNHRWVVVAALSGLYGIFGEEALVRRAEAWLAEGLDYTDDGEWTERSNGIYNAVSDIMLIYAADGLGKPELLEPVRRNLRMMAYMIHHDGDVVTDYSGRQDLGGRADLSPYLLCYRVMAERDRDPLFAAMFDLAAARTEAMGAVNNHALLGWHAMPCPNVDRLERAPIPDRFLKQFNAGYPIEENLVRMEQVGHHGIIHHSSMHRSFGAPLLRYRDGVASATMMTRSNVFFSLRHGDARLLGVGLHTMFSPGTVELQRMESTETGCRMEATMKKGYYGPVPSESLPESARSDGSPWYLLPHHVRELTHEQEHRVEVDIEREGDTWVIRLRCDRPEDVLMQATLAFDAGMTIEGAAGETEDGSLRWTEESLRCTAAEYGFELEGGRGDHRLGLVRDAKQPRGVPVVAINLLTPFAHEIRIRPFAVGDAEGNGAGAGGRATDA